MNKMTLAFGVVSTCICINAGAEESISDQTGEIIEIHEKLDELAQDCLSDFRKLGLKGEEADSCRVFFDTGLENAAILEEKCGKLKELARDKRQYAYQNPNFIEEKPVEARYIMKELNAYNKACEKDVVYKQYPAVMEAASVIRHVRKQKASQQADQ